MKKIISICFLALFSATIIYAAPKPVVNEKVLKAFHETFPEVDKPTWYSFEHQNKVYHEAIFKKEDNTAHRVIYNEDGEVLYTASYYGEKDLPSVIRAKVNAKYPGKEVFAITEVYNLGKVTYYIVLNDDKFWYDIKSTATGNISLEQKLKKS